MSKKHEENQTLLVVNTNYKDFIGERNLPIITEKQLYNTDILYIIGCNKTNITYFTQRTDFIDNIIEKYSNIKEIVICTNNDCIDWNVICDYHYKHPEHHYGKVKYLLNIVNIYDFYKLIHTDYDVFTSNIYDRVYDFANNTKLILSEDDNDTKFFQTLGFDIISNDFLNNISNCYKLHCLI